MTLLVDAHALLWFHAGDRRLSRSARRAMEADEHERIISAAVIWELAIKASLGRLRLSRTVDEYIAEKVAQGYRVWPIGPRHAARVEQLPWHHRDPFDRLLVAQALIERCPIVTSDRILKKYAVDTIW